MNFNLFYIFLIPSNSYNPKEAPITLNGIKLYNCLDTTEGIKNKLISHYKENFHKTLFKVICSIDILRSDQ